MREEEHELVLDRNGDLGDRDARDAPDNSLPAGSAPRRLKPDPEEVGKTLLHMRKMERAAVEQGQPYERTMSELCDLLPWDVMPQMPSAGSLVDTTVSQYRNDLQQEAEQGIKSAQRALERLGWGQTSDNGDDDALD